MSLVLSEIAVHYFPLKMVQWIDYVGTKNIYIKLVRKSRIKTMNIELD